MRDQTLGGSDEDGVRRGDFALRLLSTPSTAGACDGKRAAAGMRKPGIGRPGQNDTSATISPIPSTTRGRHFRGTRSTRAAR